MHEMTFVQELYKKLITSTEHITSVTLLVSSASGIVPESFLFYWNMYTKQTHLETCSLFFECSPLSDTCLSCKHVFVEEQETDVLVRCPQCKSLKTMPKQTEPVMIKNIVYDETL